MNRIALVSIRTDQRVVFQKLIPNLGGDGLEDDRRGDTSVVRIPGWDTHTWLHAGFSTRLGGKSSVYGVNDLNLGFTASDEATNVLSNRRRFLQTINGAADSELIALRQFHSNLIRQVKTPSTSVTTDGKAVLRGDGLMSDLPGVMLGIQTADCVPVLVADTKLRVVAAFHAGWRGTLARIVERGIGDFRMRFGSSAGDLIAAIGPCISACCFAVGEEVKAEFESQFAYSNELFSETLKVNAVGTQIHLDLVETNRRQLLDAGVLSEKIMAIGECTVCTRVEGGNRKYFSYRSENGFTGRMLSVIGIAPA